jgi:hypothetical protein
MKEMCQPSSVGFQELMGYGKEFFSVRNREIIAQPCSRMTSAL